MSMHKIVSLHQQKYVTIIGKLYCEIENLTDMKTNKETSINQKYLKYSKPINTLSTTLMQWISADWIDYICLLEYFLKYIWQV